MSPFLVAPKVSKTLVSTGAETEDKDFAHAFFDKHCFNISGLQVFKNANNELDARFADNCPRKVSYIGSKARKGDVYKAPDLSVFKPGDDGAWRFSKYKHGENNVIAGVNSRPHASKWDVSNQIHAKSAVEEVFVVSEWGRKSA